MSTHRITFHVPGLPAPGGSKRAFRHAHTGKIVVMDDARRNKPWRDRCAAFAVEAHAGAPLDGPLSVEFAFTLPRPKGHFGTGRNRAVVRPSAPAFPTTKPDATKLVRAVEDALAGLLWRDDAQIVHQAASKTYGDTPGVRITVEAIGTAELPADAPTPPFPPMVGRSAEAKDLA